MADDTTNQAQGGAPEQAPPAQAPMEDAPATQPAGGEAEAPQQQQQPPHQQHGGGFRGGRGRGGPGGGGGGGRGGPGRGRGGPGGGRGPRRDRDSDEDKGGFEEAVVKIYRCATVVKGGRRFSFAALVVVGDRKGQVGVGYGKANEVPNAVEKATKAARRNLIKVPTAGTSIPHRIMAKFGASKVLLLPAGEGTGVIAGASVRAVMELAGIKDILTKAYGSTSPKNLVKAAFLGLKALRARDAVARMREVAIP